MMSKETSKKKLVSYIKTLENDKDNRIQQRKNGKRFQIRVGLTQQRVVAITIVLLAILVLASMIVHNRINEGNITATNAIKKLDKDYGSCTIQRGKRADHPVQSTFTASYPGSGAKMTWKLIEAMTGLVTGDDFQINGHTNIVSIKTHYPSTEGRAINGSEAIPRAILLIRNPLHSIPSYFNFIYEYENKLPGHSTVAPLEAWIKWRNTNFDKQLQVWRRHTEYWMDKYNKLHRLVISFEKMVDDDQGISEVKKIADFLNLSDGVSTVAPEEVPCIWHAVVKEKKRRRLGEVLNRINSAFEEDIFDRQSKRGGHKYIAPFGPQQLKDTIHVVTQLLERHKDDNVLAPILATYIAKAVERSENPPEDDHIVVIEY